MAFSVVNLLLGDSSVFESYESDRNDTESSELAQDIKEIQQSHGMYSGRGPMLSVYSRLLIRKYYGNM